MKTAVRDYLVVVLLAVIAATSVVNPVSPRETISEVGDYLSSTCRLTLSGLYFDAEYSKPTTSFVQPYLTGFTQGAPSSINLVGGDASRATIDVNCSPSNYTP